MKSLDGAPPMADLTSQELAAKLRGERFKPRGPEVARASDPIADTAMVVTLDELRPYELNPRIVRNPRYDDIKASIRERGLEAPPPITRRPGETHYIIRNGGNTRLSILNELWKETKEERFYRIPCLFRPWTARGEILALTGHLAENELRGALTFIERALGVEKARELYEREAGKPLTQSELSDRLKHDGYPVAQSHISRMQDAIRYLLPSIPKILYGGLGKHQVERLIALRRGAQRIFDRRTSKKPVPLDFDSLFHDVSAAFDLEPATFNMQRLQDELIGQMASLLHADYDALMLELVDAEAWQQSLLREPTAGSPTASTAKPATPLDSQSPDPASSLPTQVALPEERRPLPSTGAETAGRATSGSQEMPGSLRTNETGKVTSRSERTDTHVVTPAPKTDRVQAIEQQLAEATAERDPQKSTVNAQRGIAMQTRERYSLSELRDIEPSLNTPPLLRQHIARLAREIAQEANVASSIEGIEEGVGFVCHGRASSAASTVALPTGDAVRVRAVLSLLSSLSAAYVPRRSSVDAVRLVDDLAPLLQGMFARQRSHLPAVRLSDDGLFKLFRLIRLARRLVDLESAIADRVDLSSDHR